VLNAGQCSTVAGRYISSTLGSAVSGVNGLLSKLIPLGFYDGTTLATMSDTNLIAGNVCTTKTIFGTVGSAICESGTTVNAAMAGDIIQNKEAWDGTGTKMTGTIINNGTLNASVAFPGAGYYGATVSNAPIASQLCTSAATI